jgi:hypothetical protein
MLQTTGQSFSLPGKEVVTEVTTDAEAKADAEAEA